MGFMGLVRLQAQQKKILAELKTELGTLSKKRSNVAKLVATSVPAAGEEQQLLVENFKLNQQSYRKTLAAAETERDAAAAKLDPEIAVLEVKYGELLSLVTTHG